MLNINEKIWQIVAYIPEGRVATYGQIARLAGYPNHARFVGATLKKLPQDTKLPWYRVVNAQGRLAFPENSQAYTKQKALLENEGVVFKNAKLSLSSFGWDN
jgi:methylated-DNA-protein-cysteine methyltransferase-like protein